MKELFIHNRRQGMSIIHRQNRLLISGHLEQGRIDSFDSLIKPGRRETRTIGSDIGKERLGCIDMLLELSESKFFLFYQRHEPVDTMRIDETFFAIIRFEKNTHIYERSDRLMDSESIDLSFESKLNDRGWARHQPCQIYFSFCSIESQFDQQSIKF
jgi:hypothetical protein